MDFLGKWGVYQFEIINKGLTQVDKWAVYLFEDDGNVRCAYYNNNNWHQDNVKRWWEKKGNRIFFYHGHKEPAIVSMVNPDTLMIVFDKNQLVYFCKRQ